MDTSILKEVIITPEIAMELLQTNLRNRPMNRQLVLFYTSQMEKGLWKFNGEPIIISNNNMLLDGQHRLAAIIKSKIPQKMVIVSNIDSNTFDTIDVGRIRTAGDMLSILNVKNSKQIGAFISAYSVLLTNSYDILNGKKVSKLSKNEIVAEYNNNPDFWNDIYVQASRFHNKIHLMNMGSIGGYMAYLIKNKQHDVEKVTSFFNQLFFDTNIENSTIPLLREKLLKSAIGQYKLTQRYKHALIVKTWNAFILGKDFKVLSFNVDKDAMPAFI